MTFTILNILILGLVLLIGYWWANQGLFSAILHLVSVIAAGTVALALWEPLTMLQLSGTNWDGYAWGVTLIFVFAVSLLIFRVALDKLAPANVEIPHWANLAFGFPVGTAAGILTMGIVVIGGGHMQTETVIMGLGGYARNDRTGEIVKLNNLWVPVHTLTADLFSYMSATSFLAPRPLRQVNPQLDHQAVSLVRDSFNGGKGALAMPPRGVNIRGASKSTDNKKYSVNITFTTDAVDYNQQLTLSASQIRLIGWAGGMTEAPVVHPFGFDQLGVSYKYDSISYYATSTPGRESAEILFHFNLPADFRPRYIQIRGTRFELPAPTAGGAQQTVSQRPELDANAPDITSVVSITTDIRPITAGTNNLPSGVELEERYITSTGGKRVEFHSGSRPPRTLRVEGFYAPEGTQIVQVRVDHGSTANIFAKSVLDQISDAAYLSLVDANGNTYSPVGYMHLREAEPNVIMMDPNRFVRRLSDLPVLPASSPDEFRLIFRVTTDAVIKGLKFGDLTIGICDVKVAAKI